MSPRTACEAGFTLIEAMVALAIVALVVIGYIGIRTTALVDATQARNWRLAREIAEQKMSELQAGAREVQAHSGEELKLEDYEGFAYKIAFGESDVANLEAEVSSAAAGDDQSATDRLDWQRNRDDYRKAKSRGLSQSEFQDQRAVDITQRLAEKAPSATEFEEAAVAVFFPKLDAEFDGQRDALLIKARLSTLAISCMTPEQAAAVANAKGETPANGGANGAAGGAANGGGAASGRNNSGARSSGGGSSAGGSSAGAVGNSGGGAVRSK